jgi:sulfatase modifying factor 1
MNQPQRSVAVISVAVIIVSAIFFLPAFSNTTVAQEAPEESKAKKFWTDPETGMKFVWIEKGCFQMGQLPLETRLLTREVGVSEYEKYYSDELPRHEICVDAFWMGVHEVTQKEWKKVMEFNPAHFDEEWLQMLEPGPDVPKSTELLPVDMVSWDETQRFIEKLNKDSSEMLFRLPTEAEWEYAARGGITDTMYYTGDSITPDQANFNGSIPFGLNLRQEYLKRPTLVNRNPPNQYGLHDMLGNVWEWCNDWYAADYYSASPSVDPRGPSSGTERVRRGGSWNDVAPECRSANRDKLEPALRSSGMGFRIVLNSP